MALSTIGPFVTNRNTKRKKDKEQQEQQPVLQSLPNAPEEPKKQDGPQNATAILLQALPSLMSQRMPAPSEVPIPPLYISMRTLASQMQMDAAAQEQPGPLTVEAARAKAAADAYRQVGPPTIFEPVPTPDLPVAPTPPQVAEPPKVGPLARPGIADFIGAIFGLIRPEYAGQMAGATLQGRMAAQADDFARKRQFWQDMMTAEQNAYANNLQKYNLETARALTLHSIAQRNRDIRAANEELRRNALIPMHEKENLARDIGGLAQKEAAAMTARQRAQAFTAAAEAMDAPFVREQEFIQKLAPSLINALGTLASSSANLPYKEAATKLREREVALRERLAPFQQQDLVSRVQDRLARLNLSAANLTLATQTLQLARERLGWDKQKFAAWLQSMKVPPKAQAALEKLREKAGLLGKLKSTEILGPILGVLTPEQEERLGSAIRELDAELVPLADELAQAYSEHQEQKAAAARIKLPQPQNRLRSAPKGTIYEGTLNGQPIRIRKL